MDVDITLSRDIARIRKDIELIKNMLLSEGELTSWARKALARARKQNEDTYMSLNDI
jgi:hypothetical protein